LGRKDSPSVAEENKHDYPFADQGNRLDWPFVEVGNRLALVLCKEPDNPILVASKPSMGYLRYFVSSCIGYLPKARRHSDS